VAADKDMVGTLAADVMAEAILAAVKNAASMYGYPASRDLKI
jgi:L-aminopeptidase/D-esterase-like protein